LKLEEKENLLLIQIWKKNYKLLTNES
jgi:hypothetical protein